MSTSAGADGNFDDALAAIGAADCRGLEVAALARERARTLRAWASSTCKGVVLAGMRVSITESVLLLGGRIGANTDPIKVARLISNRDTVRAAFICTVFEKKIRTFIVYYFRAIERNSTALLSKRLSIFHLSIFRVSKREEF